MARSQVSAVFTNRTILELGLKELIKDGSTLTEKWAKFRRDHVLDEKGRLRSDVKDLLGELGCTDQEVGVKKEFADLIREVSKPYHHTIEVDGVGIVCGGQQPLACAVGVVVALLQQKRVIDSDVRFLDGNKDTRLLSQGRVLKCKEELQFSSKIEIVNCVIKLMETDSSAGSVFNIGSDQPVTIQGLAEEVIKRTGQSVEITYKPYEEAYGPNFEDVRRRVPNTNRLQEAIGTKPTATLGEILDDIIEWKRSLG